MTKQLLLALAVSGSSVLGLGNAHPHHTRVGQVLPARAAQAQDTATGVVFHDQNRNLARDQGEPGLEGVLVSNGLEVVRTDVQGHYRLPVSDETILYPLRDQTRRLHGARQRGASVTVLLPALPQWHAY